MKRELATVFVTSLLLISMFSFLRLDPKTNATTASEAFEVQNNEESPVPSAPPVIQDFYVNSTWAGRPSTFSFNVSSPSGSLASATLSANVTGSFTNDTLSLSGSVAWADFTKTLPASNCMVAFDFWVFDANASLYATMGLRLLKVYAYNGTAGAWNTPYVSLGSALESVDSANNWTGVSVYEQYILGRNTMSLESMIDSYDTLSVVGSYSYCNDSVANGWSHPECAYDNLTSSCASYTIPDGVWSEHLVLNFSQVVFGSRIRYMVDKQSAQVDEMRIDIANATGAWTNVLDTNPPYGGGHPSYCNATFSSSQYSAMRFSFHSSYSGSETAYVYEAQGVSETRQISFQNILYWSAVCNKLNITRQQAIRDALGNYTMVGSLPYTDSYSGRPDFCTESKWALYGYWYANNSWANADMTKWNITAAYQLFNSSVYNRGAPVLWIHSDGSSFSNARYYDEAACTIECYLIFYKLLNVTGASNDALHWWNWTNTNLWSSDGTHYEYSTSWHGYECEAPFFLKIISMLKYYDMSLQNWANVLTDIGNRFLSSEWNSYQWLDGNTGQTTYVVVHHYPDNPQRRLQNTLGAWQALEGVYLQLNSTYEQNMVDMLYGTQATEPAWAKLFTPYQLGGLYCNFSLGSSYVLHNFFSASDASSTDSKSTAQAEIVLFMMGIVPRTTTIAFPLEELDYEYTYDIDPVAMSFNSTIRQVTLPIDGNGTITFQYGTSPITYNFTCGSGVYVITFSSSWNNIVSVTRTSDLPSNAIYFSQLYSQYTTAQTIAGYGGGRNYVD